jgi:hypothetical protein
MSSPIIEMKDCIVNNKISEFCASPSVDNEFEYKVNDGINIRTYATLQWWPIFRLQRSRFIEATMLLGPQTKFYYNPKNNEVVSECIIPETMKYKSPKWWDKYFSSPTSGCSEITFECEVDHHLGRLSQSREWKIRTYPEPESKQ